MRADQVEHRLLWHDRERVDAEERPVVVKVCKGAEQVREAPRLRRQVDAVQPPLKVLERIDKGEERGSIGMPTSS